MSLDLASGALLLRSSPANFAGDFAAIQAKVSLGHTGTGGSNHWNSTGMTSAAATQTGPELFGLALSSGADYLAYHGPSATFNGESVNAYSILVDFTYVGDASFSGNIDIDDYLAIDHRYLTHTTGYTQGDFNYDNTIDFKDYALIDNAFKNQSGFLADEMIALHTAQFGTPYTDALALLNGSPASIPEPSTALLLTLASLPLLRRRLSVSPAPQGC